LGESSTPSFTATFPPFPQTPLRRSPFTTSGTGLFVDHRRLGCGLLSLTSLPQRRFKASIEHYKKNMLASKSIKISREELQEQYWKKGLSTREIGKRTGVWHTTILKYMRRYGIPRRLSYRCRQVTIRIDEHLAYVFGVLVGDASVITDHRTNKCWIQLSCKDRDFAESFAFHLTKVLSRLHRPVIPRWNGKSRMYIVQAYVPDSCTEFFKKFPTRTEDWRVPDFIMEGDEKLITNFLRGFADAEGSVCSRTGRYFGYVELCSINKGGLEQVKSLLRMLGLTHGKIPIYETTLRIHARLDLQLFYDKIGFSIKRKQKRLHRFLKGYKTSRCIGRKPSREALYNFYWVRRWSQEKIAKELGVNRKTIGRWMAEEGIPSKFSCRHLRDQPSLNGFRDHVAELK